MDLAVRQRKMKISLTCPICLKLFTQLTVIPECSHRFCYRCITKKINEEGLHNCPVCKVDLGCSPLQSLRIDYDWQSIMEKLKMKGKKEEDKEGGVRRRGAGEVSRCNKKLGMFWFSLVASDNQKSKAPLEQIPSKYLRVKDANITVSCIKKYLMQKLNLGSENEVEIRLEGRVLVPNMEMWKVVDLWSQTTAASQRKPASIASSAHDFVFTLTYASTPMPS